MEIVFWIGDRNLIPGMCTDMKQIEHFLKLRSVKLAPRCTSTSLCDSSKQMYLVKIFLEINSGSTEIQSYILLL